MSVGLLDVNMLLALAWPSHVHYSAAQSWFVANRSRGWATCPMTQCAFVRIASNPRAIDGAVSTDAAFTLLKDYLAQPDHFFWADDVSLDAESVPTQMMIGHKQVTDAYLLGLAIGHRGKLVTFDRSVGALLPSKTSHAEVLEIVPA